jgi:orotate phosphoribosyltransferase
MKRETEIQAEIQAEVGKELARISLAIGSIRLQPDAPFRWASGYRMPIYNDNRMLLASPEHRQLVAGAFEDLMLQTGMAFDLIAGTATAGIPHATSLADRLELPLAYVRADSKGHGMGNRIEGVSGEAALSGKMVLLVEDLISTGGSSIAAVQALREAGAQVPVCLAIFSYGLEKARRAFDALDPPCRCIPILEYDDLISIALGDGSIDSVEEARLREWREAPFEWGSRYGFPPEGEK